MWCVCEVILLARRIGRTGYVCLALATVACLLLYWEYVGYQSQTQLISRIEAIGAFGAYQTGWRPSAPIDFIYLDEDVGNEELRKISALEGLDHLERLVIVGSRITDQGLVHLKRFPKLRDVYFRDTPVAESSIDELRRELPNCIIVFDTEN